MCERLIVFKLSISKLKKYKTQWRMSNGVNRCSIPLFYKTFMLRLNKLCQFCYVNDIFLATKKPNHKLGSEIVTKKLI